jgi:hypothetical protein
LQIGAPSDLSDCFPSSFNLGSALQQRDSDRGHRLTCIKQPAQKRIILGKWEPPGGAPQEKTDGWMYGYGFGPIHWLWFIVMIAVVIYPVGRILSRIGFSPLWSIVIFIPLVNLIALWIFAFTDWPDGRAE